MKKALISPNELIFNYDDPPVQIGVRVAEVAETEFPVASPLFWTDCSDEIEADVYYYSDGKFEVVPLPPPPVPPSEVVGDNGPAVI